MVIFPILIILGIIYYTFSSRVSAIPFFPTHKDDVVHILESLNLKKNMIVFDLGAGTGTIIFAAAIEAHEKNLDTKFVAIDINFLLCWIMKIKRLFHPNRANIEIIQADLFTFDYASKAKPFNNISYYMYVSPWFTNPLAQLIQDQGHHSQILSYYYPIKGLKEKKLIDGAHPIYLYTT